ncbi:hypothetical protein SDC9_205278 [bioreactor metagenome]|uniref:Uncharacterized protein n=1 Tax=bioreactor metagenome TaxID=1076179 RepID=A0A645JAV0_9ZZZZ
MVCTPDRDDSILILLDIEFPVAGAGKIGYKAGLLKVADVLILVRIDRSFRYASGIFRQQRTHA